MHFKQCILVVMCSIWEMQSKFCNGMPSDDCLRSTAQTYTYWERERKILDVSHIEIIDVGFVYFFEAKKMRDLFIYLLNHLSNCSSTVQHHCLPIRTQWCRSHFAPLIFIRWFYQRFSSKLNRNCRIFYTHTSRVQWLLYVNTCRDRNNEKGIAQISCSMIWAVVRFTSVFPYTCVSACLRIWMSAFFLCCCCCCMCALMLSNSHLFCASHYRTFHLYHQTRHDISPL